MRLSTHNRQAVIIMAKNILSYRECERFYLLRDTLAAFTHIELGLEGDFLYNPELMDDADDLDSFLANVEADADAPLFDEQAVAAALDAAFTDPDIIDRYIAANQTGFNASDLAVVESWKCALTDQFVVFKHAGKLLFLGSNRIFHVTGLVDPIADVLGAGGYPRIVTTTLLPFGDKIVYSGFMYTMPLQFGSGMQSMLADEISRALKTGAHISRGEQLVELAPTIVDERIKREADLMMEELELDMKAEQQLPGHHKGVLADMDADAI